MRPHIFVINVFYAPFSYGGATIVAEQVVKALRGKGACDVTAISMCSRSDLVPYSLIRSEKDGVVNYLINLPAGRNYSEIYNNPRVAEIIGDLADQFRPDLVHLHCIQDIGAGCMTVLDDLGIPVVLSVHDFWWICERQFMIRPDQSYCGQNPVNIETCRSCVPHHSAAKLRMNYLFRQAETAAAVTYPSKFARELCEASGFAPNKGVVWENGVRPPKDDFFTKQSARRARDPRICFGFLGGPSQIKGWPLIRRTFSDLNREDFRGLLVDGSIDEGWWGDEDLDRLRGDWQVFPRFDQDNIDDFYAEIDVLLFMSQWKETFGLAIREAISRGIRVVQTDSGGTTEHPLADPDKLIPIGAGSDALKAQVEEVLHRGTADMQTASVATYADQAAQFLDIISPILAAQTSAKV